VPLITHTTACTEKTLVARGVYQLRFSKPDGFTFQPGQFVLFDVPLVDAPEDVQPRALSVASLASEEDLLFIIKLLPGGRMSRWIDEVVTVGTPATFKGPFGNFQLHPDADKDYFFISTGAGLAPFRPMVLDALTRGDTKRMDIVFGVRSEEDLFWVSWFEELSHAHPNVFHHLVLSQPSAAWTGHKGRVQSVVPLVAKNDFSGKSLYVCGNPDMTTDVKKLALTEWGMDKKDLHVEGYI
jgi:ferredoxin-NADP reductase